MPILIQFRDRVRSFVSHHEYLIRCLWNGILMLIGLVQIGKAFPVEGVFGSTFLTFILTVLCAFLPLSGCVLVLSIIMILHIAVSSASAALVVAVLMGIGYLITSYYQSKAGYELVFLPIFRQVGVPFTVPMVNGLIGQMHDLSGVIVGGFTSYSIGVIADNLGLLTSKDSGTNVLKLLMSKMLQNKEFYFYMVAIMVVFLVTYLCRTAKIRFSWLIAVAGSLLLEFAVMFAGYLFSGNRSSIPGLLLGNFLTLILGLFVTYFLMDLNYARVETIQYEDDEYYYYVTAVPKVHVTEEQKTVKKITRG